jgi:hypothetical protein
MGKGFGPGGENTGFGTIVVRTVTTQESMRDYQGSAEAGCVLRKL